MNDFWGGKTLPPVFKKSSVDDFRKIETEKKTSLRFYTETNSFKFINNNKKKFKSHVTAQVLDVFFFKNKKFFSGAEANYPVVPPVGVGTPLIDRTTISTLNCIL